MYSGVASWALGTNIFVTHDTQGLPISIVFKSLKYIERVNDNLYEHPTNFQVIF